MKWKAEADLVVGVTVGSGKRKLGFGFGIGRRKIVKRIGIDLGEEVLRRAFLFCLKGVASVTCNWSSTHRNSVYLSREKAMKRSNVLNLLLQMMPSSQQPAPAKIDHWAFLEEVDAPQWVDLVKEADLMGTQGDDPWFHRTHPHHETSLARIASVAIAGNSSSKVKPRPPSNDKITMGKSNLTKVKPSLKANSVKACLGGMQRVSGAGSREGRLSSRPRVTLLSTSQTWPKNPKKVHVQRQTQKKPGAAGSSSSSRTPVYEPSSEAMVPKKSYEGKIGHFRRCDPSSPNQLDLQESRKTGIGRNGGGSDQSMSRASRVSQNSDKSVNVCESPNHAPQLYRLPSPPSQESGDLSVKSSPSDMRLSCDSSPKSSSSAESIVPQRPSSTACASEDEASTHETSGMVTVKSHSGSTSEIRPISTSANSIDVEVNEPSLEISSFKVLDRDFLNGDGEDTSRSSPPWHQQISTPPRQKRRSLGPPLRVKQIENLGSSSLKKKSSSRLVHDQDVVLSDKLIGAQATHPILEKLRRSWGSALRVKQRQDAEMAIHDRGSDNGCQNSDAAAQKLGCHGCESAQPGGNGAPLTLGSILYGNNHSGNRNAGLRKDQIPSEPEGRDQRGGEVQKPSQGQGLAREARRERGCLAQQATTSILVSDTARSSPTAAAGKLSKSKSMGTTEMKSPAKIGLSKIQANHQRSKSDINSKFKKQYPHPDTGISKSSPLKGNKENMNLDVGVKTGSPSPPGKRKMQNFLVRSSVSTSTRQPRLPVGGSPAASPVHAIRTGPQARTSVIHKTSTGCRPNRTSGQEVTDPSAKSAESLDRKLNNLDILRGSASSLLKLTKQKSQKVSPTFRREANSVVSKGCKSGGQVADETVTITVEERRSRIAPQYEPRLHTVKVIREWESKSGKRYYDLQPMERQKVNQEITAASKAVTKRCSA